MKKSIVVIVALFLGVAGYGQKKKELINEVAKLKAQVAEMQQQLDAVEKAKEVNLEDKNHKFSYAFGVAVGNNLKIGGFGEELSYNVIAKAIQEVMEGKERIALEQCLELVQSSFVEKQKEEAAKKSEEGAAFLAENGKREGVITTESGLQYEVITQGNGPVPKASDQVSVHYTGMLIDGKVFDSSVERGEPQVLGASQVIKGWQEALQSMPVGSKWKLYIPYDLGYGERGAGGAIPPYAALIFEIELLEILSK
ncbi:FKBP-type peptidyl-prolyl cis-trans isomerase [Spongiimicrobium salis]|uniref:FKBP-type peptidyl-prolyl cis-trans isomerase n=1 Tax=Spongiimicrobium salis TaxID=1667022 RepID=UPI00374CE341